MNITFAPGILYMNGVEIGKGTIEEIDEMRKRIDCFMKKMKAIMEETNCVEEWLDRLEMLAWERNMWRGAAALARCKAAAMAQAFAQRMEGAKARRAMKRRKMLRGEGRFPDMAFGS